MSKYKISSPLLDRNTSDPSHNALPEKAHASAHKGEKADFKTIEEENKFRKFVNESNLPYAELIKLDLENKSKSGRLNNPTVQKAYKKLGVSYQIMQGKLDVFGKKKVELAAIEPTSGWDLNLVTKKGQAYAWGGKKIRDVETPHAINPLSGDPIYIKAWDFINLARGSNMNESNRWRTASNKNPFPDNVEGLFTQQFTNLFSKNNSFEDFKDNFKTALHGGRFAWSLVESGESSFKGDFKTEDYFVINEVGEPGMEKVQIRRVFDGAILEFWPNNYTNRSNWGIANDFEENDFPNNSQVDRAIFLFMNGYNETYKSSGDNNGHYTAVEFTGPTTKVKSSYHDETSEKNPYIELFNTYTGDGKRIKNKDDYAAFLYPNYKIEETDLHSKQEKVNTSSKENKKQAIIDLHAGNPLFSNIQRPDLDETFFNQETRKWEVKKSSSNVGISYETYITNSKFDENSGTWIVNLMGSKLRLKDVGQDIKVYGYGNISYPGIMLNSELHWSRNFPNILKANNGYAGGIYNAIIGSGTNYWESRNNMIGFFSQDEDKAAGALATMLPNAITPSRIGMNLPEVPKMWWETYSDTDFFITTATDARDKVFIHYKDQNGDIQKHTMTLPFSDHTNQYGEGSTSIGYWNDILMDESRNEFVRLFNFLKPKLEQINEENQGVIQDNNNRNIETLKEVVENDYKLSEGDRNNIYKQARGAYGEKVHPNYFMDEAKMLELSPDLDASLLKDTDNHDVYLETVQFMSYIKGSLGIEEESDQYKSLFNKKAASLLVEKLSDDKLQLKFKDKGEERGYETLGPKLTNTAQNMIVGVEKEVIDMQLQIQSKMTNIAKHPNITFLQNFNKVYNQALGANITFSPSTTYATHKYEVPDPRFSSSFKYGGTLTQEKEITFLDEIEIEIANGTKLKIDRNTYNEVVTAFSWLKESQNKIKVDQEKAMLNIFNKLTSCSFPILFLVFFHIF